MAGKRAAAEQAATGVGAAAQRRRGNNPNSTFDAMDASSETIGHRCFSAQALHISFPLVQTWLGSQITHPGSMSGGCRSSAPSPHRCAARLLGGRTHRCLGALQPIGSVMSHRGMAGSRPANR